MELGGLLPQFRVASVKRPEVLQGERMLLDRHVVKLPPRTAPPRLECDEEIEAEAEAGLEDDEALALLPALRQTVALQEDMLRLRGAAGGAVIHVAEGL